MKVRVNFNNRLTTLAGAIAITLASGASANPPASSLSLLRNAPAVGAAVVKDGSTGKQLHLNVHADVARYTVILKEEPVATYDGLVSGYPKISRNAANGRLDVKSKEAVNYANYLRDRQNQFLSAAGTQLKRSLNAILQFQHAVNGVVVELTPAEASELAKRDDVLLVDAEKLQPLLTNRSTSFIGADKIWDGSATGGLATQGEGIVIGDIDSGINFTSPSFASPGPVDSYVYTNPLGAGNYLGLCQPGGVDEGHCNAKLIGLYDFVYSICSAGNGCGTAGTWTEEASATDSNGHGSHTASTAAGNHADVTLSGGDFIISGVAPHASLVAYDTCYTRNSDGGGLCPTTSTTAAANQAVADGIVDVLTFSIGGGTSPWTDSTSMAFLGAQNAGIFVVAAAGNDGPTASTVSHVEPWVATAAASTDDQVLGYTFNLTGPGTPPANTVNLAARPGANPQPASDLVNLPITQSPGFANGNNDGCSAFASAHTFDRDVTASERIFGDGFEGTSLPAIYQRGIAALHLDGNNSGCGSGTRRNNALAAGAAGVIFVDTAYLNLGASDTSYSMTFDEWNPVYAQISTDPANATASVLLPLKSYLSGQGDVIADFSSRGPNAGLSGQAIVKPEVAAPGVAILAAFMGDPGAVALEDGTSMSTPHIAGSAALLRALHPEWTPTQIRSVMMLTAKTEGVVKQDGSPADIWERGAGRIDLTQAAKASLTLDETGANYLAANPATGGKIATLNLPSIADSNCIAACNYSRTVRSVHAGAVTYALSVDGFAGGSASVSPANMTVSTGGSKTFTVTVHGDQLTSGQYTLGQVTFTPSDPSIPVQHMPVAVKPGGPIIQVSANSVAASQDVNNGPTTQPLTITNIGNPTLNWSVGTGTAALSVMNTATTGNGELGGYYNKIPAGSYLAQNFDVTGPVRITKLTANGFVLPSGSLNTTNTPGITFKVYADNAGVPDGSPGDPPTANNGNAPIFAYTNTISSANGITTTSGALNLDLTKVGVPALNLTAGRYWLVVAPNINSNAGNTTTNPLWAWRVSSDPVIGNSAQIIGSLWSLTDWEDVEATPTMLSTIVSGTVDCTQPSWVSYAPTSDALGYNASTAMTLTFDPTGLTPGNYAGNLCISSNATNKATAVVVLNFAVTGTLTHKVTPSVGTDPSWGTIAPDTQQTINDGATTQFTLTPASGYHTDTVGGTCGGTLDSGTNVFTTAAITADCTVIANFAMDVAVTHLVTPSVGTDPSWGTIAPDTAQTVNDGATTQFTLQPASGYHTDTVGGTCGGTLDGGTGVFTTNAVTADCSVVANFAADPVCTTGSAVEVKASMGTPGPSGYPALKDAFDAINAGTHQGAISVSVCGNTTETASAALNASGSGAASYSAVTVHPDGGAARTVSGAIAAGGALINLNGADNVTIDGLNSGGNALTLSNTTASATAGTSTIRFIEGATNNTVTNTTILGSAIGAVTAATGTVLFSTSTVAGGNSNNTVSNNDIGPAGTSLPAKAIQGLGTSTVNANSANTISGNKIHDFFAAGASNAGISVYNFNTGWTIASNRIYQTAPRTFTNTALRYTGILIDASTSANGGNAFQITDNVIGFGAANGTGTTTISGSSNEFRGILLNGAGTSTASTVHGNTISGIVQSSSRSSTTTTNSVFIGIEGGGPSIDAPVDILSNSVGSLDGSSTIVINASSTAANTAPVMAILDYNLTTGLEVSGNNIGAITINQNGGVGTLTGLRGILSATGTTISRTISNNTIGGPTAAGGIVNNLTGGVIYGIQVGSTTIDATGNLVQNITNNCTTVNTVAVAGLITTASTGANTISQNTIRSLVNNAGTINNSIYALYTSFATNSGSVVDRNFVHSLVVNSTAMTSQIAGILPVAGSGTYQNNMVRLGFDAAGNPITNGIVMYGMFEIAGTNNVYNNSVYIGGSGVASSSNTFAFVSNVTTGTRNYMDNIFWNARSNASGTATNTAGALSAATGATSDYNDLYADGIGGVAGPMAAGLDVNSVSVDPLFVAPTGTVSTVDLHVQSGSPVIGAGTPIAGVTNDFDGDPRSATAPTIGADEGAPSGGGATAAHGSSPLGSAVSAASLKVAAPAVPEAVVAGRLQ
jgi:hypothetical protein